jgi:hypothetical protein
VGPVWDIGQVLVKNFNWLSFALSGRLIRSFNNILLRWEECGGRLKVRT